MARLVALLLAAAAGTAFVAPLARPAAVAPKAAARARAPAGSAGAWGEPWLGRVQMGWPFGWMVLGINETLPVLRE